MACFSTIHRPHHFLSSTTSHSLIIDTRCNQDVMNSLSKNISDFLHVMGDHFVRVQTIRSPFYMDTGGNASNGIKSRDPNMSGIKNKTGTSERII